MEIVTPTGAFPEKPKSIPKMSVQLVHLRCHLGITLILATNVMTQKKIRI